MHIDTEALIAELLSSGDQETTLRLHLDRLIAETRAAAAAGDHGARWQPGEPLRLFLAGYNGTQNTGADLRVVELLRQLRHLVGPQLDAGVMVAGEHAAQVFAGTRLEVMDDYLPVALWRKAWEHHGVIACEGSMFKSNFSEILSLSMTAGLALSAAQGKLAVAYGGEAGQMSPALEDFVRRNAGGAHLVCRSAASVARLGELGLSAVEGVDTAWTFAPADPARGGRWLREAGWDGAAPVVLLCPVNPFWWPVRPDPQRAQELAEQGLHAADHYGGGLFHRRDATTDAQVATYLRALAEAVEAARARGAFVALLGMERLDRDICERLAARIGGAPLLLSAEEPAELLASVLREATLLISSRFHAVVLALPAGVPALGVSLDERIANLLRDQGHPELLHGVSDPDLGPRLVEGLERVLADHPRYAAAARRFAADQLRRLGWMGLGLTDELRRVYPDLPLPERPRTWAAHLPPLAPELERLLEEQAG